VVRKAGSRLLETFGVPSLLERWDDPGVLVIRVLSPQPSDHKPQAFCNRGESPVHTNEETRWLVTFSGCCCPAISLQLPFPTQSYTSCYIPPMCLPDPRTKHAAALVLRCREIEPRDSKPFHYETTSLLFELTIFTSTCVCSALPFVYIM
jgi:hypothetical protein